MNHFQQKMLTYHRSRVLERAMGGQRADAMSDFPAKVLLFPILSKMSTVRRRRKRVIRMNQRSLT